MSQRLINLNSDLQCLRDDGYDVEIRSNYLLIKNIPYVNSNREIKYGTLVSTLQMAGDITTKPDTHVALFVGEYPCHRNGSEIVEIKHQSIQQQIDQDLVANHSFSSKPGGGYNDYYDKMNTYATIISSPAHSLDPSVTARFFPVILSTEDESVFNYLDTASSRAGINMIAKKLEIGKIGIVGLGGTGAYVLDLVSKTQVREIHLFDGDKFSQHNAFRSPGALSLEELQRKQQKVAYFQQQYEVVN